MIRNISPPKLRTNTLPIMPQSGVPAGGSRIGQKLLPHSRPEQAKAVAPAREAPSSINTYPYFVQDNKLMKQSNKDDEPPVYIGRFINILSRSMDEDTKKFTMEILFDYSGGTDTVTIGRELLTRNKILDLLAYGVDISDDNCKDVLAYLRKLEAHVPITRTHSRLGFAEVSGSLVFKHYRGIGCDSTYKGNLLVQPKGTEEEWYRIIRQEVLGTIPLELAVALGLAAPVASMIARDIGLEVILTHINGDSTQGKTTAARLALSPFGCPDMIANSLMKTWNATDNGLIAHLRGIHGIPIAFDEASTQRDDFTSIIYTLGQGLEKAALNKDRTQQQASEWSGHIISTAEHSLLSKAKQNNGLRMRVLELSNIRWTTSAENADALKQGLINNYGHAGPRFVEHLLAIGKPKVLEVWRKWSSLCLASMPRTDQFSKRLADKLAVILTAADLAKEALGLELHVHDILSELVQSDSIAAESLDLAQRAYDYLVDRFIQHTNKFESALVDVPRQETWGKHDGSSGEVSFLKGPFEALLRQGGFEDTGTILKGLRDKNLLSHEANKFTRKKTISGQETRAYVIKLPKDIKTVVIKRPHIMATPTKGFSCFDEDQPE